MYIRVRVTAGAKNESFMSESATHFQVAVREKAEQNMANKRVRELVSEHFAVPIGRVRIVNGHMSPSKLLSVDDA